MKCPLFMLKDKPEMPYEKMKGLLLEKASLVSLPKEDFVNRSSRMQLFDKDEETWSSQKKEQWKNVMGNSYLTGHLARCLNPLFEKIAKEYELPLFLGFNRQKQEPRNYQDSWKLYNAEYKVSKVFSDVVVRCVPLGSHLHHFLVYAHKNYESNSLLPPVESIHNVGGSAVVFMKAPNYSKASKHDKEEEEYLVECLFSPTFPTFEKLDRIALFHNVPFYKVKEMFEFLYPLVQKREYFFSISNEAPRFVRFHSHPVADDPIRFCFWNPFYYKDRYK